MVTGLFAVTALGAIIIAVVYLYRGNKARAGLAGIVALAALAIFSAVGDSDARSKGFANLSDMQAATRAGVTDPEAWVQNKKVTAMVEATKRADAASRVAQEQADQEARDAQDARASEMIARRQSLLQIAKEFVRNRLKDPSSADIRTISDTTDSFGHVVVCGAVNAKNSFGGYTGMKGFVATPESGNLEIEGSDDTAFNIAWTNNCRR